MAKYYAVRSRLSGVTTRLLTLLLLLCGPLERVHCRCGQRDHVWNPDVERYISAADTFHYRGGYIGLWPGGLFLNYSQIKVNWEFVLNATTKLNTISRDIYVCSIHTLHSDMMT